MKIKFLGVSNGLAVGKNFNSNIIIEHNGKRLLYDAGVSIGSALESVNLVPQHLDSIFISHLHSDHCGGVEYIAFKTYFETFKYGKEFGSMKPTLIGEIPMLMNGWSKCWQGGLEHVQGKINKLSDYFNVEHVSGKFDFNGLKIKTVPTTHVVSLINTKSYGLFIDDESKIFITGDTQFINYDEYKTADIIYQDCEFAEYSNSSHAQFKQLCSLPADIKRKMYLYHYSPNNYNMDHKVRLNGFAGLVQQGQEFR